MDSKKEKYKALVEDVANCTSCDKLYAYCKNYQYLEYKTTNLNHHKERTEINLWTYLGRSLNADILILGQDFGALPEEKELKDFTFNAKYPTFLKVVEKQNKTDRSLKYLLLSAFDIDISQKERTERIFFTNSILCYRSGPSSGGNYEGWYVNCNKSYISRLIEIIRPKIIITLGELALFGLGSCGTFSYENGEETLKLFKDRVRYEEPIKFKLEDSDCIVDVFPVYHCGYFAGINKRDQIEDWKKIRKYYDKQLDKSNSNKKA